MMNCQKKTSQKGAFFLQSGVVILSSATPDKKSLELTKGDRFIQLLSFECCIWFGNSSSIRNIIVLYIVLNSTDIEQTKKCSETTNKYQIKYNCNFEKKHRGVKRQKANGI